MSKETALAHIENARRVVNKMQGVLFPDSKASGTLIDLTALLDNHLELAQKELIDE